jgi:hypothetical protein
MSWCGESATIMAASEASDRPAASLAIRYASQTMPIDASSETARKALSLSANLSAREVSR